MKRFEYAEPKTLIELVALMHQHGDSASILAGGTDLINHISQGKRSPEIVVSLRSVAELSKSVIERREGVEIGALATLTTVAEHPLVRQRYTALAEAAVKVGSKQIRNRGTVVGNVCNASPAADTITALLLFDPVLCILGEGGRRTAALAEFLLGPGQTTLAANEMVENIFLPTPFESTASTYLKLSRREGVDLATVGVATSIDLSGNVRIALGAVGPKAFRAFSSELQLKGSPKDVESIESAIRLAQEAANPISDLRASSEYRCEMIGALLRQALQQAMTRCEGRDGGCS
jgi:carbon-monoxide dehydrogenase medium subunit